jgi:hypothetical protein
VLPSLVRSLALAGSIVVTVSPAAAVEPSANEPANEAAGPIDQCEKKSEAVKPERKPNPNEDDESRKKSKSSGKRAEAEPDQTCRNHLSRRD